VAKGLLDKKIRQGTDCYFRLVFVTTIVHTLLKILYRMKQRWKSGWH